MSRSVLTLLRQRWAALVLAPLLVVVLFLYAVAGTYHEPCRSSAGNLCGTVFVPVDR